MRHPLGGWAHPGPLLGFSLLSVSPEERVGPWAGVPTNLALRSGLQEPPAEGLCSLGVGQGGPSPAPHPGWSLGPGRAPRQTASRPQPPGHRGCGSLQPCGGLVQVALSGPRGSERLLLRPLPTPFPAFCLRPLGGALSGGSDAEVEASGSHVSSVMSGPVSSVGFESSTSPLGTSHTVRTLLPRDLHMRKFQVGQPSLLPWPRALAG